MATDTPREHSRLRWGAIARGAAVDGAGTRLCATTISMVAGIRAAIRLHPQTNLDPAAAQAAMQSAMSIQPLHTLLTVVGLLCSVAGGYLTAYLAKMEVLLNAAIMGTCSGIVGLLMASVSIGSPPTWSQLALTVTTVPAAMLGGLLCRLTQRPG